ncbi:PhzF family phenazine biosynthesis protein [Massilia sp. W12]|uniref:PhzF family phenazine biosynthesis protein n=1 Tax=Massilia sp. W12 TaxID=3126507 RepID=UPI0030D30857
MQYHYRLLNVFAESTFGGNPLCVFENGSGLSDAQMQLIARQFNLSETVFLLPADTPDADMRYRIFTPGYEMPFAGHPTLGSAHVLRSLLGRAGEAQCSVRMVCQAGLVPVHANGAVWRFRAPSQGLPPCRPEPLALPQLLALLGLQEQDLAGPPQRVNTGKEQLLLPLRSKEALQRATPGNFKDWPDCPVAERNAYLFVLDGEHEVAARFFWMAADGSVGEDPGTGSACANLGGWLMHQGAALPLRKHVTQGEKIERLNHLYLEVDAEQGIHVGGSVIELGRGYLEL